MDNFKNNLLQISEVAKKFNISRPTLIHYDQIDLLKPTLRNDKNYRYYSEKDLNQLELILALKESGLTIKEIKAYMAGELNTSNIDFLINQQLEIDKKIKDLEKQKQILSERINKLKLFKPLEIYEGILIDDFSEIEIIKEDIGYGPFMSYDSAKSRLKNKLNTKSYLTSKFGICFDISLNQTKQFSMKYVFNYLHVDKEADKKTVIPASRYLKSLHHGSYSTAHKTINKMILFAKDNNISLANHAFFIPLFDYWESTKEDEFVNEILIPFA